VLSYAGTQVSDEEAAELCDADPTGSVADLAVHGLVDAGIDARLRQFDELADLCDLLEDAQPVIVLLRHPSGQAHAVVLCEVRPESVIVMDPARGDYVEIARDDFERMWGELESLSVIIGSPPSQTPG
jgi:ABC-type bacteriocin/lantibiotic exporter with double-glycine peptidase domain